LFNKIQAANAAEILQRNGELSDTTVARLMQKLQPAQRAKIMGFVEPAFATRITKLMVESAQGEIGPAQVTPQTVQSATLNRTSDAAQLPYYYEATGTRKIMCDRPGDPLHPVLVSVRLGLIDEAGEKTAADLAKDTTLPKKMDPYMKKIRVVILSAISRTTQDQLRDVEHLTSIKEEIRGILNREVFSEVFPTADTSGGSGVIRLSEILFSEDGDRISDPYGSLRAGRP
ncbi:MAG: hypothetical protein IT369_23045, partial [Candidatus Latescibacteria bacterium]|nr:hypothetical protein [Candidatus Latescibacterota bacterium]